MNTHFVRSFLNRWREAWPAIVCALLMHGGANGDPELTVTPNPINKSVLEGESGIFDFTVKNVGVTEFTVTNVTLSVAPIVYISDDILDEVFATEIVNAAGCAGKTLSTNGTCQFQQSFRTRDLDMAHSGTNVGIWEINNRVFYSGGGVSDIKIGSAIVEVRDPGAATKIPEPSAMILVGSVCGMIIAHTRASRRHR